MAANVPLAHQLTELEQPRGLRHREPNRLVYPVDTRAQGRPSARNGREDPPQPRRNRVVGPRHHPGRGALVELEFGDLTDDLGHDLNGAGPGADHRDALAGKVDVVVPPRGMESGAAEFVQPVEVRNQRDVQPAGTGDEELGHVFRTVGGEYVPAQFVVVPYRAVHMRAEVDVAPQPVLAGDTQQIVLDLRLERPHVRPVGLRLEGERVHVRRDVAGTPGVGVVAPGPADLVGLLEEQEFDALPLQGDGHPDTGEPGTDDQGTGLNGRGGVGHATTLPALCGTGGTGYFASAPSRGTAW